MNSNMNQAALNEPPQLHITGATATITLCRPAVANRLGPDDLTLLGEQIKTVNGTPEVLVLRIIGTGKYFCSGFDIGKMESGKGSAFEDIVNALEECRPVTIAAINGGIYGGATDLALACDFRVGTPAVDMFMPAARLGLHFYERGLQRYVSRLGIDTAKRLFLTAERLTADEMKTCGFLTSLVDNQQLLPAVDELSARVAGMAPLALLGMKKHLNRIAIGTLDVTELEADILAARNSQDLEEGRQAWKEKRKPIFTGR